MQVVCETTQSPDVKVKVAALQCLVRIMSLYYQYMETYMGPALFAITLEVLFDLIIFCQTAIMERQFCSLTEK